MHSPRAMSRSRQRPGSACRARSNTPASTRLISFPASNGKFAQLGYHGAGGGDIVVVGSDLTIQGGSSQHATAQIGNGSLTGDAGGDVTGDIVIDIANGLATFDGSHGEGEGRS